MTTDEFKKKYDEAFRNHKDLIDAMRKEGIVVADIKSHCISYVVAKFSDGLFSISLRGYDDEKISFLSKDEGILRCDREFVLKCLEDTKNSLVQISEVLERCEADDSRRI